MNARGGTGTRRLTMACRAAWMILLLALAGCGGSATLGGRAAHPAATSAAAPPAAGPAAKDPADQAKASAGTPATPAPAGAPAGKGAPEQKNYALVQVYYATDRSRTGQPEAAKLYGAGRGTVSYGWCEVAVPRDPKMGKLEAAAARLEAREPANHRPVLRKVVPRDDDAYLESLKAAVARSPRKSAFVFVHGYNVSFAEAARRTAQMKYDLGFDGAPIFFSWPSKGKPDAFPADEADVEWAQPDLRDFLKEVAAKSRAKQVYLIGHGTGTRALTKAFIYLSSERPELAQVFRQVILVAPDMDAQLFKREIAPALAGSPCRTTLYCSSRDPSLKASLRFQDYPRAGDSGERLTLFEGIDTVDASTVKTSLSGHSSIADNASVLADIYHLIRDGKSPAERAGLKPVKALSGQYWKFKTR